ncbi:MAG: 3-deoxy-manno-octulosonate cytidylyltransferase [Bacteroidota bacterium]
MKVIGIIPARFGSTRFPGKPLADINGTTMIQRVYEQAKKSNSLSNVLVATDDDRIYKHVKDFGGIAIMTSSNHQSGTDRCREAVLKLDMEYDVVVNIQGDEPYIDPMQIDLLVTCFKNEATQIATLVKGITLLDDIFNKNIVKVVIDKQMKALYFSRSPIPFSRNCEEQQWLQHAPYYKHIGIYAYRNRILKEITELDQSILEKTESLEQLRWLENGYGIQVAITELESIAVDSPEDILKFKP